MRRMRTMVRIKKTEEDLPWCNFSHEYQKKTLYSVQEENAQNVKC